ncbi:DUF2812 domain-containing protein [Oceanobacillus jeddahense]|uniref:DUF2812 domain-containing protein n=1 Tax=Oceanobacillus jeddahense TaxID=1462527 RepID=A0ABY5JUG7_9BACI|nr:DUF2812 domain-containing protein [Oceanobacillus jeddahense]UUI02726.1 DUF2812 domain-containing protein [Oceanobacillus jeddahense]
MRQTKYMMSGGLAFSEEKDMKKLHQLSLKGWHVNDFKFMGYTLEKGESSDYIYSIDYRLLGEEEEAEYFDFFTSSGWSHVASNADIHLFRADPGTKPIYSDSDTNAEKYKNTSDFMTKLTIPLVFITALVWIGAIMSSGVLQSILLVAAIIFSAIALPAFWTIAVTYSTKWKTEGKYRLANLAKMITPLLFFSTIILIMFIVGDAGFAIRLLAAMIIGGIALPAAIRGAMSLYYNK